MLSDPLLCIPLSSPTSAKPSYPKRKLLRPSPDHPDDYILELDYSSISAFMECPRKSENLLIRSREANRDNSATDFGTLFHSLESQRLEVGLSPETIQKQREDIAQHFLSHQIPATDHRTGARMENVMKLYNERYGNDGWPQKVFRVNGEPFVERAFKIELATIEVNAWIPYSPQQLVTDVSKCRKSEMLQYAGQLFIRRLHILYTGRIDAVLQESNGLLFVTDHKTSSRGGREFEEAFRLSLQTRGYCWAAQKLLQREVAGLIMNAVIVRPLTKTGTGTEFNRITYFYRQDQIEEFETNMKAVVSDFVSHLVRGFFPQHSRSFISPCAKCDFSENCTLPPHQRAADLASELYRDVVWNPINL